MQLAQALEERRTHPRHDVDVAARYWIDDERAAVACDVLDISLGGTCVELPAWAWLEPGSYATVELPVPGGMTLITTPVKVLAVSIGDTRMAHLRFLDDSRVFKRMVRDATETWKQRRLD
jgi:hypothetical protein